MICKKDVIQWFKELESYKRIDTMCSLLIVCLPFELRFLGTCLEELGRRDSQELRGMELRANNPQDLAADMVTCQKGEPTDIKIRRKMALYLALIRACNRTCVSEIFRTLECWGDRDFASMSDQDTLLELLLVYTMAANHPVFSFHQQMICCEILSKIKENKLLSDQLPQQMQTPPLTTTTYSTTTSTATMHIPLTVEQQMQQQQQHMQPPPPPPSHQDLFQQHSLHALHPPGQPHPQLIGGPVQMLPQGTIPMIFPQHMHKLISNDGNLQAHQLNVDGIPHMMSTNITTIPADTTNAMIGHPNTWAIRSYPTQQQPITEQQMPQQSPSPMLSQQSSPSSSRASSPIRMSNTSMMQQQQQQVRSMPQQRVLKNIRRPSAETTPPPQLEGMLLQQNLKHMDDGNEGTSGNQLQNIIRNGFTRGGHHHHHHQQQQQQQQQQQRIKAGNYMSAHQQQQSPVNQPQHYQPTGNYNNANIAYYMQAMNMNDMGGSGELHSLDNRCVSSSMMSINSNKSATTTGSDTASSSNGSTGEITPPETPTLSITSSNSGAGMSLGGAGGYHQKHHLSYNKQQMGLQQRLNGRNGIDKSYQTLTQPQQQQPMYTTDLLATNNSNTSNPQQQQVTSSNPAAVLMTSSPTTTPSVLLQATAAHAQGQPSAYNATAYPAYHLANANTSSRPPPPPPTGAATHSAATAALMAAAAHGSIAAQPVHGGFRFPLAQHNGEMIYPAYHPSLAFMSAPGAPPPTPPQQHQQTQTQPVTSAQVMRNSGVQTAPQQQPQMPYNTLSGCASPAAVISSTAPTPLVVTGANSLGSSNSSSINMNTHTHTNASSCSNSSNTNNCGIVMVGSCALPNIKNLSCYNCGSQTHSGRDCHEASMEDATRSAVYKLDYSVAAATTVQTVEQQHKISDAVNSSANSNVSAMPQTVTSNVMLTQAVTASK